MTTNQQNKNDIKQPAVKDPRQESGKSAPLNSDKSKSPASPNDMREQNQQSKNR